MKRGFVDKLLERLERLDPAEARRVLQRLTDEQGLFAQVLDALAEGVVLLDGEGVVSSVNRAASQLLGLTVDELLGEPADEVLPLFDWNEALVRGQSSSREMEILGPEPRRLHCVVTPLRARVGAESVGFALLVREITQQRRLDAEQIDEEKLGALTLLAAGVAHELGNPLNSLDIHLQLLQRRLARVELDEGSRELLAVARGEVGRLDGLIKQFLQALRPTELETELSDLNAVLLDALEFLRDELEDGGIELELELDESLPPLHLDRGQLRQALYNVLRNARQALRGAGGRIVVSTSLEGEFARIRIEDNGVGMDPQRLADGPRPFASDRPGGHGLGLLIVRRILRAHGGRLSLSSRPGRGTVVTLDLPLAPRGIRLLPGP